MTNECNPTGPAASWDEQFEAADIAVRKVDPDAVLTWISASPSSYYDKAWLANDALDVDFHYILSGGELLTARLLDTDPSNVSIVLYSTEEQITDFGYYADLTEHRSEIEAVTAKIKVSPREAVDASVSGALGMPFMQGSGVKPIVSLHFDPLMGDAFPMEKWAITYIPYGNEGSDFVPLSLWPRFNVDIASGAVKDVTKPSESQPITP